MSCHAGPDIVENSLVFCYDMNNTQKSWKGMPITNQKSTILSNQITPSQNYTLTTFSWINITDILDITATKALSVLLTSGGQNGKQWYWVNQGNYQGKTITWSWYVKSLSGDVADTICIAEGGYGSGNTVTSYTATSQWKRVSVTRTINTSNSITLGSAQDSVILDKTLLYTGFQLEESSFATPFVNGTRSTTQSILDLTNNNTITANNLTYNSDGAFSFDGTDDYLSLPSLNLQQNFTLECWAYITGDSSGLFGQGNYGTNQGLHILWNAQGNRGMIFGMYSNDLDSPSYTLTYNAWHHYVFTYNHTTYLKQFYADGTLFNSGIRSVYSGTGQFNIGAIYSNATTPAKGKIASVKFYNRVLSAAEVAQNFNATRRIYGI